MPLITVERHKAVGLLFGALTDGGRHAALSGDCSSPVVLEMTGRPDAVSSVLLKTEPQQALLIDAFVRCRKCPECLAHRSRLWTARAINECAIAPRTWFGTLTVEPATRFKWTVLADMESQRTRREPLSKLSPADQFKAIAAIGTRELTLWLKRVRKNSGANLRYLLVCEAHADGFPHWHCLVHEVTGTVTKRVLDGAWRIGFSQFRLAQQGKAPARYVCKYLAKSALTRVRASFNYGDTMSPLADILHDRIERVREAKADLDAGMGKSPRLSKGIKPTKL